MNKIDLHTHQLKSEAYIQILNIFAQDLPFYDGDIFYSAGIHPWHLEHVNPEEYLHSIELASVQPNMLAVGEFGLDRSITINFALQELYFRKQVEIAEKYSNPLIIHCVRAFPELLKLKKESRSTIPWIIHGFQGNEQATLQLIKHNFYFSVGERLLSHQTKKDILATIPIDRLFLETDDREISISKIYSLATQLLNIDEETLCGTILENFKNVFRNKNVANNKLT